MRTKSFSSIIQAKQNLIADGATGTTLISRGLPQGATAETWVMEQPEKIIQLHKDFIEAGANIILTSTFGGSSIRLKGSLLDGKADQLNRKSAQLARQAVGDDPVYVAGSLGPVGQLIKPYGPLNPEQVRLAYADQARSLADGGVDLLVLETQFDMVEIKAAIQGIRSITTLPLVVSLSYDRGVKTMMGISPSQAARELENLPFDMIGINCGHSLDENLHNLVELRQVTSKPIWFKPNAGLPHMDRKGATIYDTTPEMMGAQARSWLEAGALIIGGCCGTSPDHLREISRQANLQ